MVMGLQASLARLSRSLCRVIRGVCDEINLSTPPETVLQSISPAGILPSFVPPFLYEVFLRQIAQVVVTNPVKEATQTSGAVEVAAQCPHCQTHSPLAQVSSNKRSRREQDLQRQKKKLLSGLKLLPSFLCNKKMSLSRNKNFKAGR